MLFCATKVSNDLRRRSSACRRTCTRKRPRTPAPGAHRACQIRTRRSSAKRSCGFLLGSFKSGAGSIAPAEAAASFPSSPVLRALFWRARESEALSRTRSDRGSSLQPFSSAARASDAGISRVDGNIRCICASFDACAPFEQYAAWCRVIAIRKAPTRAFRFFAACSGCSA